jgi:hypothetical protein
MHSHQQMKVLHLLGELKPSGAEVMLCLAAPVWQRCGVACGEGLVAKHSSTATLMWSRISMNVQCVCAL